MLRKIVAEDHRCTSFDGSEYDVTYILPTLIAMGFPASGIVTTWRNSKEKVASFLQLHHQDNYFVWNLTEREYDGSDFDERVHHVGFPDHGTPLFNDLISIISEISHYMEDDVKHVAVVHCKAGRGRTGLICSCVLLAIGIKTKPFEALQFFAERRSNVKKGSTSPPQVRYCYNFGAYLSVFGKEFPLKRVPNYKVGVKDIAIRNFLPNLPTKEDDKYEPVLYCITLHDQDSKCIQFAQRKNKFLNGNFIIFPSKLILENDVVIVIGMENKGNKKIMGRIQFHTFFIDENGCYTLNLKKIQDPQLGINRNEYGFPDNFEVQITFEPVENNLSEEDQLKHEEVLNKLKEYEFDNIKQVKSKNLVTSYVNSPVPVRMADLDPTNVGRITICSPIKHVAPQQNEVITNNKEGSGKKKPLPPLPPKPSRLKRKPSKEEEPSFNKLPPTPPRRRVNTCVDPNTKPCLKRSTEGR